MQTQAKTREHIRKHMPTREHMQRWGQGVAWFLDVRCYCCPSYYTIDQGMRIMLWHCMFLFSLQRGWIQLIVVVSAVAVGWCLKRLGVAIECSVDGPSTLVQYDASGPASGLIAKARSACCSMELRMLQKSGPNAISSHICYNINVLG
jgi:hypothetical protein